MDFSVNKDTHKIIIQLQIGLKIALFSKLEHFKYIVLIKILVRLAILQYIYVGCHYLTLWVCGKPNAI